MVENKPVRPFGPAHITGKGSPPLGDSSSEKPNDAAFAFGTSSTAQWQDTNIKRLLSLVAECEYADIHNRTEMFNLDIYENPSWSMLFLLYKKHTKNKTCSISSLISEYKGMQSTALRWLDILVGQELILISKLNPDQLKNRSTITQKGVRKIEN